MSRSADAATRPPRAAGGGGAADPPDSSEYGPHGPDLDARLVTAHCAGDAEAFGELFVRHADRLWATAVRLLHDPQEAEDAVQDGMIRALRAAEGFRGDSAVGTWLHRIVVNVCLSRLARAGASETIDDVDDVASRAAVRAPGDLAEQAVARLTVTEALSRLPQAQRAAIVLVDLEGWSVAEAAGALGVAEGTVKSRCSRGREALARLLKGETA